MATAARAGVAADEVAGTATTSIDATANPTFQPIFDFFICYPFIPLVVDPVLTPVRQQELSVFLLARLVDKGFNPFPTSLSQYVGKLSRRRG